MDEIYVKQFIFCTKSRRGKGVKESPTRVIVEIYDLDGTLIAENDPLSTNPEDILGFMRYHFKDIPKDKVLNAIHEYFIEDSD